MWDDIWSWLEIEPTIEVDVIRSAYAKQATKYHPEEYPQEFQHLQSAYKQALKYATIRSESLAFDQHLDNENTTNVSYPKDERLVQPSLAESFQVYKNKNSTDYDYNKLNAESSNAESSNAESRNAQPNTDHNESSQFTYQTVYKIDNEMQNRLNQLSYRINRIYNDQYCSNNIHVWKKLFENYYYTSDFSNLDFLEELIDELIKLNKLPIGIRKYLYKKIFTGNDSNEYLPFKSKFKKTKISVGSFTSRKNLSTDIVNNIFMDLHSEPYYKLPKGNFTMNKRGFHFIYLFIIISIITGIIKFSIYFSSSSNSNNSNNRMYSDILATISLVDIEANINKDSMLREYAKNMVHEMDLNNDGYNDKITYNSETEFFEVSIYIKVFDRYDLWGNVNDYVIKHPEVKEKVKYFLN